MTEYTVVPAAPGSFLIEAILEMDEEAEVFFQEHPVVAWRVPVSEDDHDDDVLAVIVGHTTERADMPHKVEPVNGALHVSAYSFHGGLVSFRGDRIPLHQFRTTAAAMLTEELARRLSPSEDIF
jgi:hypothetical protein